MAYRLYSFVNHLYMSPIQWGIQTAHCVSTMMNNVAETKDEDPLSYAAVHEWAAQEPTIIVCQGGNAAMLTDLYVKLVPLAARLGHPIVKFHEDDQSLGGVITCAAVVVPERFYAASADLRYNRGGEYDPTTQILKVVQRNEQLVHTWNEYSLAPYEMLLAQKLNEHGLAS